VLFLFALVLMGFHLIVSQLLLSLFHIAFDSLSPLALIFLCAVCVGFYLDYHQLLAQRDMIIELKIQEEHAEIMKRFRHELINRVDSMMAPIRQVKRSLSNSDGSDAPFMAEVMRRIEQSLKSASETANSIRKELDYLREIPLDESGNIGDVFKEVYENFTLEFEKKAIKASLEIANELPQSKLNRSKLFDAFYNLVKNSCEAMPEGGRLTLEAHYNERKSEVQVEISDTGVGIPQEIQAEIFRPGFSTKASGFGMGLANVKHIVAAHKGDISFKSEEGLGTTFTLTFPIE
jgi:signal transduction histidine kinase